MARLSAAEKQRLYRQRRDADPARRAEYLQKRKQGYARDIATKKRKRINDLNKREKRAERKAWRVRQQRCRQRLRARVLTPPPSPDSSPSISRQLQQGRRQRRSIAQKKRKEIEQLKEEIEQWKKRYEKVKKRNIRLKHANLDSPEVQTRKLLQGQHVNTKVRKVLKYHFAVLGALKYKYKSFKDTKSKQSVAQLISERLIRKYKCKTYYQASIGCHSQAFRKAKQVQDTGTHKETAKSVRQFFVRDDVSRLTTGKKNTITLSKVKRQRRLLTDSLLNLHKKYASEYQQVSYSFFCRQKPFWVVAPNERDRETCQCKTHENLQFMADKLYRLGISSSRNLEEMSDSTACSTSKTCAYGDCFDCKSTAYPLNRSSTRVVTVTQWCQEKVGISMKDGETRTSTITIKKDIPIQEDELVDQFQNRLFKFRRHLFNIRWQYNAYKNLRESLTSKDSLIHIDFSENYACRYSNEIQSVHFGGSHQQVTLHTGVLYLANQAPMPFCTISPSRRHDPPAIWAHLDAILALLAKDHTDVKNLHFFSDGPATQYKNRSNFYMISTEPHQRGFSTVTWSFFEASHGKGAPDGVGAALKRTADTLVRQGKDIPDAQTFLQLLKDTSKVKLFYVSEEEVEKKDEVLRKVPLHTIKGTMRMHEVLSVSPGVLKYRDISCFCQAAEGVFDCPCHGLEEVTLAAMDLMDANEQMECDFRPSVIEQHHSGAWCVVQYEGDPYPGIILQVEENTIKVKCMHRNGVNKFYWPSPRDDVNWYGDDQIMCLIPEPLALNKRSVQIDQRSWEFVMGQLDK